MQKASEIWSAVNSEAAAAAKGAWEGVKPAHKVFLSDIIASPKKNAFVRKWLGTDITSRVVYWCHARWRVVGAVLLHLASVQLLLGHVFHHRVLGNHVELPQAVVAQVVSNAEMVGVRVGVLRRVGGPRRPDRVGVVAQISSSTLRYSERPAHAV